MQFLSIGALSVMTLCYYLNVKPYIERADLYLEVCNELCFWIVTYFILLFSNWVPDLKTKTKIGWAFSGFIGFQILCNFTYLFVKLIGQKIKDCKMKKAKARYDAFMIEREELAKIKAA